MLTVNKFLVLTKEEFSSLRKKGILGKGRKGPKLNLLLIKNVKEAQSFLS